MPKKYFKKKPLTLRRVKNWVLSIIGLTIIFMAISFSIIRGVIKYIPDYTQDIQAAVSKQLGVKVEVGFLDAEIVWLVPRLKLFDVNVYDKNAQQQVLHINEIGLSLDWFGTIHQMMPVVGEISLDGLNLQAGINKKSQLLVQDYVVNENIESTLEAASQLDSSSALEVGDNLKYFINNMNFKVLNSQIRLYDERHKKRSKLLSNFNLRLLNGGNEHDFEITADLPGEYGEHVRLLLKIDGDLFDYKNLLGEVYLSLEGVNAAPWLDDYWGDMEVAANANINAQVWLNWDGQEITDMQSRFNLHDVALHYLESSVKTWKLDQLSGEVQWQKNDAGWQLDVRDLKSARDGKEWPEATAAMLKKTDENREIAFQANFVRIEGVAYLAGMANSVYEVKSPWVDFLHNYKPSGDLKNLDVSFSIDSPEKIKLNTEFSQLGFILPGNGLTAVKKLQGKVASVNDKTWIALNSTDAQLQFGTLFRNNIDLSVLKGLLDISKDKNKWSVNSNYLQINTPHISTESRVAFSVLNEGRPFLDLTTQFKNGNGEYVSLYLPAGVMGKNVVKWLDTAITSGQVTQGGYQFFGYLQDLPFRNNEGISLADFNVTNVGLKYLGSWPEVNGIDANVRIKNDSVLVHANKGSVLNSQLVHGTAYLDNFVSPMLDMKGEVKTQLADITKFINNSGLRKNVTNYIDNIELTGQGNLDLKLFVPLSDPTHLEWGGVLQLDNGNLNLIRENYQFTELKGNIQFANGLFESPELSSNFSGDPVKMQLKTERKEDYKIYHMIMSGKLSAKSMFSPLPVSQKYFDGFSSWEIGIDVSTEKNQNRARLDINIRSDLVGVSSSLPGPLGKTSNEKIPLTMKIQMMPDAFMKYDLQLAHDKKITLQEYAKYWRVVADTPSIIGQAEVSKKTDIVVPVKVNLDYFDIDKFNQAANQSTNELPSKTQTVPREIPSIVLTARQLKWQHFNFNEATVTTRQTKLGMVIDAFNLQSTYFSISGKGSWYTGWNEVHTTSIDADISIYDLGLALKELELSDEIKDGKGDAHMRWKWSGMPHQFSWKALQGDGRLTLEDGTISQFDAGAGRMLGIFNFKTLLSMDYANQVSKGFAFDKAKGSFSFANGNAYTDDFHIESKVADIYMNGRLSIEERTVDQKVAIRPHVESTVAIGTAIVAGPAVGGIVYLFQKLFDPKSLSEYQYSMKGKISDPVIELLSAPVTDDVTVDEFDGDF